MPRKQTRRSISVSAEAYAKIRQHCDEHNLSMSGFVEDRIRETLGLGRVPLRPPALARVREIPEAPAPVPLRPMPEPVAAPLPVPITAAEVRQAIEPPPLFLKKVEKAAPAPKVLPPNKIFTF